MQIDGEGSGAAETDDFSDAFAEFTEKPADKAGAGDEGGEPAAEADKAPAADDAGAAAPANAAPDPWADAPAELIAERDRLIQERDRAVHSDQSQRGRIGALQRKVDELARGSPQEPPAKEEKVESGEDRTERLKQLREEYPDVAVPVLDEIDRIRQDMEGFRAIANSITGDREAAHEATELAALAKVHPDWDKLATDDSFLGWLATQSPKIIDAANSSDARDVSTALTLFKFEQAEAIRASGGDPDAEKKPDARRQKQLEGSRSVTSRPTPAASGAPSDFDGAFGTYAARKERVAAR